MKEHQQQDQHTPDDMGNRGTRVTRRPGIDARIEKLENERLAQRDRDDRQDTAAAVSAQALQSRLDRIDSKLDRLIERSPAP